jgi:hypothetical protein
MKKKTLTDYDLIKERLENFPVFRERRFRYGFMVVMVYRELGFQEVTLKDKKLPSLTFQQAEEFGVRFDSLRHAWGQVTAECKQLRGKDYEEKVRLEQEKQMEMGYEPGFEQDVKKLTKYQRFHLERPDLKDA